MAHVHSQLALGFGGGIYLTSLPIPVQNVGSGRRARSDSSLSSLQSQQTTYRGDLHCSPHHLLLILFDVFSQPKEDVHFSFRDHFIIKISVKQDQKVVSLTSL